MSRLARFFAAIGTPSPLTCALGLAASILALPTVGQTLTGTFQCQSIVLNYATGPSSLAVGFTTPSTVPGRNPQLPLNGECEYNPGNINLYQSYWVMYQGNQLADLGMVGIGGAGLVPDSDGNGIPNFAERSLSANVVASLVAVSSIDGSSESGTITLTRAAGRTSGTAVTRFNSGYVFNGNWLIPLTDVSGSYKSTDRTLQLRMSSDFIAPGTLTGTYLVNPDGGITLVNIVIQFDAGPRLTSSPITFSRTGKTYRSLMEFIDGDPVSNKFPDFRRWTLQLSDPADSDGDGIPNLSDSTPLGPLPVILTQPVGLTKTAGQIASFTVTASGTAPLSYQWFLGGIPIAGATSSSYTVTSVATTDAGSYTVVVRNQAGQAVSSAAVLTVNPAVPPKISLKREANGRLTFTWSGNYRLQWSPNLTEPFSQVSGAASGYQTLPGAGNGFYRLAP